MTMDEMMALRGEFELAWAKVDELDRKRRKGTLGAFLRQNVRRANSWKEASDGDD